MKLEGRGTGNTDYISDDVLLKQPPPEEDCPICLLRLPLLASGYYTFQNNLFFPFGGYFPISRGNFPSTCNLDFTQLNY